MYIWWFSYYLVSQVLSASSAAEQDGPRENLDAKYDESMWEGWFDVDRLATQLSTFEGKPIELGPLSITIEENKPIPATVFEGEELDSSDLFHGVYDLPPPFDKGQHRASFWVTGNVAMGSMTAFRDGKRHVAILTMQQDASGKFSGNYGFELELEAEPMPDFDQDQSEDGDPGDGAGDGDLQDDPNPNPTPNPNPAQAAEEDPAERHSYRRQLAVPNRDVYTMDGKPENPQHHGPAATIKSVLTFVVFDRSAWRMFWNYGVFVNGDNERKARATQYWNLISRDYITPVFLNLGPFAAACPAGARPCGAEPNSVGYDFDPKLVFLGQDFNFPPGGLNPVQQYFTRGHLSDMLETEINLPVEIQNFMANGPDTKVPIPLYILVTGQDIRGGVASDIDGFPNSLSGNVMHYGKTFVVEGASAVHNQNAYDTNILAGYLSGYRQVGLTDWDKGLWQHEIGHMMGAWHTHDADSPVVQRSGYPDQCGTECVGPNMQAWSDNYFNADHKGSIMSYCHQCPVPRHQAFFQDIRFWEGNLETMRSGFQLWQRRVNNGGVWTKGYSKFQFKLDKTQTIGTGDQQAEVLLSEDSRCVLVVDGLTGQIQLFVRGNGKDIIWSVGALHPGSKLRFQPNGDLQHITSANLLIKTIVSVGVPCGGAAACTLKLVPTAPRTRATSCEMQIFAPGNPVAVWRSNNINVDDIQANPCAHTDGVTANPAGCICGPAKWGKPPERTEGANVYCDNIHNIQFEFPTVFGVCAETTGLVAMNVDPREACKCGATVCRLYEQVDAYCYQAASKCRPRCPNGLNPGGNMAGCVCHLNPRPTNANAGEWCDRAGDRVLHRCGDISYPPCVCGNYHQLCQPGNKCEAGVCMPVAAESSQMVALQLITKLDKLPKRTTFFTIFGMLIVMCVFGLLHRRNTHLKEERTPLLIL